MKLSVSLSRTSCPLSTTIPSRSFAPEISHLNLPYNSNLMRWLCNNFEDIKTASISSILNTGLIGTNVRKIENAIISLKYADHHLPDYKNNIEGDRLKKSIDTLINCLSKALKSVTNPNFERIGVICLRLNLVANLTDNLNLEWFRNISNKISETGVKLHLATDQANNLKTSLENTERKLTEEKALFLKLENKLRHIEEELKSIKASDELHDQITYNSNGQRISKIHGKRQKQAADIRRLNLESALNKTQKQILHKQEEITKCSNDVLSAMQKLDQHLLAQSAVLSQSELVNYEIKLLENELFRLATQTLDLLDKHFLQNEALKEEEKILHAIWEETAATIIGAVSMEFKYVLSDNNIDVRYTRNFPYSSIVGEVFNQNSLKTLAEGLIEDYSDLRLLKQGNPYVLYDKNDKSLFYGTLNYFGYIFEHVHYPHIKDSLKQLYIGINENSFRSWIRTILAGLIERSELWNKINQTKMERLAKGDSRNVGDAKDLISCIYLLAAMFSLDKQKDNTMTL